MWAKNIYFLIAVSLVLIKACNSACWKYDEEEAIIFLEQACEKLYDKFEQLQNSVLSFHDEPKENKPKFFESCSEIIESILVTANETNKFCYSDFEDEELKRNFDNLRKLGGENMLGKVKLMKKIDSMLALKNITFDRDIPSYRYPSVSLAYIPDIQNIFTMSSDPEELKYYWTAWRAKNNKFAGKHFRVVIEMLKYDAEITGTAPSEYWLKSINITEMESIITQLKPLYVQMHAFIRNQLNKLYGSRAMKPIGPIPDHLFQHVLAQSWTDKSVIDDVYPLETLPPYSFMIRAMYNFDPSKQYREADNFYRSLGFEPIREKMWDTQLKMKLVEDVDECETLVVDLTSNVHLRYCPKMYFWTFLQAHGYMGQIYYAREKANIPSYYFSSYNLEYAVGNAALLSASSPRYLSKIGIPNNVEYNDEMFMNRLLRMAIHVLPKVSVHFVHSKFMADLFNDSFNISEHNKYYWQLMYKYMGVVPPDNRTADAFDFPLFFYEQMNTNEQATKFYSEILGYQFYKRLCEISGQYPKGRLQNCDFSGSKDAGDALKKMMKLGSSKPYDMVLATLLHDDPKISAEGLLEYYRPVMNWLREQNAKARVEIDWTNLKQA